MDQRVVTDIHAMLQRVEGEEDVRILLAVESGSRAWGFPSEDSDYDVRFLYVHRQEWYLSIDPGRDVIERPLIDLIDLSGSEFIDRELPRLEAVGLGRREAAPDVEELNRVFRNTLEEAWEKHQ